MKDEILNHINDPRQLEKMYRNNKTSFKQEFSSLYSVLKGNALAEFWNERLTYENDDINWGTRRELILIILGSLIAGFIAKLPAIFSISEDFYYPRNIGFILFPVLSAYFAWKNKLSLSKIAVIVSITLAGLIFINFLPDIKSSDTTILSCIHLLLILLFVLGFSYVGTAGNAEERRLNFLKFNGDLVVMTTLIGIAGGILTAITIGLFSLIGLNIEEFYFKNIVIFGLPAAPIFGTFLIQTNPQLVGKVSPVIAKIFSPLVLVMLVIYLIAMVYSGKDPYNDREFLTIFNVLLIGVMAIVFFSIAEGSKTRKSYAETWILFLLSLVTIIVNGIALSAIVFRIAEWGVTPNRVAVLGANLLVLTNLIIVATQLFKIVAKKDNTDGVGKAIAMFLPVYLAWAIIVTFMFPFVFGFK